MSGLELARDLFVRISTAGVDNPSNNTAVRGITIYDDDAEGPIISGVDIGEEQGDGDGAIGDDEHIRISWSLVYPSGICSVELTIDGGDPVPLGGAYFAVSDPLPPGQHGVVITATDCDNTPASSDRSQTFDMFRSEAIQVLYIGRPVPNGAPAFGVGTFLLNGAGAQAAFSLHNNGQQVLHLGDLTVPGFDPTPPGFVDIGPGQSTSFAISIDTRTEGEFSGQATLLVELIYRLDIEFWHTPDRDPYVTIDVDEHRENWPVRSSQFRSYLANLFYSRIGKAIGAQGMRLSITNSSSSVTGSGSSSRRQGSADRASRLRSRPR